MKQLKISFDFLFLFTLLTLIWPDQTQAYLDPGTGSLIVQIIISAVLGSLFALKLFYAKIKQFFKNLFSRKNQGHKDSKETK